MKAIIQDGYGDPERVLRLADIDRPTVADTAVLVRVRAASVNSGDWRKVRADPFLVRPMAGWRRPRDVRVGVDAAGVVEEVGGKVTHVAVGDEVYGMRDGAFAEYVSGRSFVRKPANLSFEEAAAVPAAGCTALQAIRDRGNLQAGESVLVNGAGGGVGTYVVQLAKAYGGSVTAATRTENLELLGSLGADEVIDYTRDDFVGRGKRYDLVVDCGGNRSVAEFARVLKPGGRQVLVAAGKRGLGAFGRFVGGRLRSRLLRQPVVVFIASGPFDENLDTLRELIEAGKVRPVIDRSYPLADVAAAIDYASTEGTRGKVVITI